MKRELPLGLFGWCAVIFVSSFMPWATSAGMIPFFGGISAVATGWTGNISVLGVIVPNWVSVILAGAIAVIGWLRANAAEIKPKVSFWLALGGIAHLLYFIFSVKSSYGAAQLGLGSIATLVSFVAILRLLKRSPTVPSPILGGP